MCLSRKSPIWELFTSYKNKLKAKCQVDISKLNEKGNPKIMKMTFPINLP